jgi:hypothetical protein
LASVGTSAFERQVQRTRWKLSKVTGMGVVEASRGNGGWNVEGTRDIGAWDHPPDGYFAFLALMGNLERALSNTDKYAQLYRFQRFTVKEFFD